MNRRKKERLVLSQSPGVTVSFKVQDPGQVYISWDEWSAANHCVLAHMLREGDLPRADVEYYLAYLTYIYELVPLYEWTSILEFDTCYRETHPKEKGGGGQERESAPARRKRPQAAKYMLPGDLALLGKIVNTVMRKGRASQEKTSE